MIAPADLEVLIPTAGRPAALTATLAGLVGQTATGFAVRVSSQDEGPYDPAVVGVARVLRSRGSAVRLEQHLPRRGIAEHRDHLLRAADAPYVLFLDDDVLLEPGVVGRLLAAMDQLRCGFVGAAFIGLSHGQDRRPAELAAFEPWTGPVQPERVRKGDPAWERWRLHNAANPQHLAEAATFPPDGWLAYRVAWIAGCVLYDRAALLAVGGFGFWRDLPVNLSGEDVVAQLRVLETRGGAGVLPSGAYHLELPTSLPDRGVDAYAEVLDPGRL